MRAFSRFRRDKTPDEAVSDEERMVRYVHLLNTLPTMVIEKSHASAFKELPVQQRREMFERLRPFLSEAEKEDAAGDPAVLAKLYGRAVERRWARENDEADAEPAVRSAAIDPRDAVDPFDILSSTGATAFVTSAFITGYTVSTYFLFGAGSSTLDQQPAWLSEVVNANGAAVGDYAGAGAGFDRGGVGGQRNGSDGGFGLGGDAGLSGMDYAGGI